jgi:hypothetical protein
MYVDGESYYNFNLDYLIQNLSIYTKRFLKTNRILLIMIDNFMISCISKNGSLILLENI